MNNKEKNTDLFERYVYQIGKFLPKQKQKDIQREIISSLEDALDDRSITEGRAVDEEMIVAVIKEYGSPKKVAASYRRNDYLIGPRLYPLFLSVIKISLIVFAAIFLSSLVGQIQQPFLTFGDVLTRFWQIVDNISSDIFQSFGVIVLVFILIERGLPNFEDKTNLKLAEALQPLINVFGGTQTESEDDWDPRKLPATERINRIYPGELIFGILWTLALLIWINFFPHYIGYFPGIEDSLSFVPILAASFGTYILWISLHWGLRIFHMIWLLVHGQKTSLTRWANIALKLFGLAIIFYMITGPTIFGLNPEYLALHEILIEPQNILDNNLISNLNIGMKIALLVTFISHSIQAIFLVIPEFQRLDIKIPVIYIKRS